VILSAILFGLACLRLFSSAISSDFHVHRADADAVNLAFVAFSQALGKLDGQVFVLFVIAVAAAEAAVGLGIIILMRATGNLERRTREPAQTLMPTHPMLEYLWIIHCCRCWARQ